MFSLVTRNSSLTCLCSQCWMLTRIWTWPSFWHYQSLVRGITGGLICTAWWIVTVLQVCPTMSYAISANTIHPSIFSVSIVDCRMWWVSVGSLFSVYSMCETANFQSNLDHLPMDIDIMLTQVARHDGCKVNFFAALCRDPTLSQASCSKTSSQLGHRVWPPYREAP